MPGAYPPTGGRIMIDVPSAPMAADTLTALLDASWTLTCRLRDARLYIGSVNRIVNTL